jgi:hypothetical protein
VSATRSLIARSPTRWHRRIDAASQLGVEKAAQGVRECSDARPRAHPTPRVRRAWYACDQAVALAAEPAATEEEDAPQQDLRICSGSVSAARLEHILRSRLVGTAWM